jgi:SAM-dependent methyltransferase
MQTNWNLLTQAGMDLETLAKYQQKPAPFTPGTPLFWDDPHISKGMLAAHLNPEIDLASRRPETIDRSVAWIVAALDLRAGDAVLDLGCGPGLYAARLAQHGLVVTGVDASRRSVDYARQYAEDHHLAITYRYADYLSLEEAGKYKASLLIFGEFCTFNPEQRRQLLDNVHRALKPGGYFVLDVSTRPHREQAGAKNNWLVAESGFWRPGPHLVLETGFDYPEQDLYLDQMIVIEENGAVTVYRNWFQDYTPERITQELEAGGFLVESLWGDLTGTPYSADAEWIGVVARRKVDRI